MLYYESDSCEIRWIEDSNIVHFIWKGYAANEEYPALSKKAMELLQLKKSRRFLSDNTHVPVFPKEYQEYLNNDWFPTAIKSGLKKVAIIEPSKVVQRGVMDRIAKDNTNDVIQTEEFPNYDEAMKWLKM